MKDDDPQSLGMDGLFKELTWSGNAISQIFDLPPIVGDPISRSFSSLCSVASTDYIASRTARF